MNTNPYRYSASNFYDGHRYTMCGYLVTRDNNAEMIAPGDSGGPIFSYANNNTAADARGIYSGYVGPPLATCPSWTGRPCYNTAIVADIVFANTQYNQDFAN